MNVRRIAYLLPVLLFAAYPASAQWYVHTQTTENDTWRKERHSWGTEQDALRQAKFYCGLGSHVRNARIIGPGKDTVVPCSAVPGRATAGGAATTPATSPPAATPGRQTFLQKVLSGVSVPGGKPLGAIKALVDGRGDRSPGAVPTPPSVPPAASHGPASGFDLVGLRLGMSPAAADEAVRRHMPVGWVYVRDHGKSKTRAHGYEQMKGYLANDLSEIILVYFEPSLSEGQVVGIRRHSMIGKKVDPASVEAALARKYGTPSHARNGNWVWGQPSGCSASGVSVLSLLNVKFLEGVPRRDRAFQDVLATGLDLAEYDLPPPKGYYDRCRPVLAVLRHPNGLMTTLADQRLATALRAPDRFDDGPVEF